jgi:hypothetical protein
MFVLANLFSFPVIHVHGAVFLSDVLSTCVPVWDGIAKTLGFSRGLSLRRG